MPELPEVETVKRSLEAKVTGLKIVKAHVFQPKVARAGVFGDFAQTLEGKQFVSFARRGKYLIASLTGGVCLVVHLRMTGRWVYAIAQTPVPKHTHIIFALSDGNELRFTDLRRFGGMDLVADTALSVHAGLAKLGVEPLSAEFTPELLRQLVEGKRVKVKSLILDQTKIAGLGNIYADEALFKAGINPERTAATLEGPEIKRLHAAIREVLQQGVDNKGTTFRDYVDGEGRQGSNQFSLNVYGRSGESCYQCGTTLAKMKIGGRTSVYCPNCQPTIEK